MKKSRKGKKKIVRTSKLQVWLFHYLNQGSHTFLNGVASVREAGYKAKPESHGSIAYQNYNKVQDKIEKWLDEHGLSDGKLKGKLLSLVGAKETVFQKVHGIVNEASLIPGTRIVIAGAEETVIEVTVEALELQRRALDMALKVKGLYAPERHKVELEKIPMSPAEEKAYLDAAEKIARGEIQKALEEKKDENQ